MAMAARVYAMCMWALELISRVVMSLAVLHKRQHTASAIQPQMSRACSWRVSRGKAQEGVWLLVTLLPDPRQALPNMYVQWSPGARDACANSTFGRRDFPPFLIIYV